MQIIKASLVLLLCMFGLIGCGDELTESYLMEHPSVLRTEANRCQSSSATMTTPFCSMVLNTISKFMAVVTEQELDPEGFGRRILKEQMALAAAKQDELDLGSQLDSLKNENADQAKMKELSERLQAQQQVVKAKQAEVDTLLTVVSMSSPG